MQPIPGVLPALDGRAALLRRLPRRGGPLVDTTGTLAGFAALLEQALAEGARSLLVLTGEGQLWPEDETNALLRGLDVPVCGAVVPRVIAGAVSAARGTIVWPFERELDVSVLSTHEALPHGASDALAQRHGRHRSLMLLGECGAAADAAVEAVRAAVAGEANLFGARVGTRRAPGRACLYTNDGLRRCALQVVGFGREAWASQHGQGWRACGRTMTVTGAEGSVIHEIDFQPAAQVYLEAVERLIGVPAGRSPIGEASRDLPLGLHLLHGGIAVRQPIAINGSQLVCSGGVPLYGQMQLLRADPDSLARAASVAASGVLAQGRWSGTAEVPALVFVANARPGAAVQPGTRELDGVALALGPDSPIVGACTLGAWSGDTEGGVVAQDRAIVVSQAIVRR